MLQETIKALNKKFGNNTITLASKAQGLEIERVSTGSLSLDIETGGGLPLGRLVEIFGEEGVGKSFLGLKIAKEMQALKKDVLWVDTEGAFTEEWAHKVGVDTNKLYLSRAETGEKCVDIIDSVVRSGSCGCVILDSVAALIPTKDVEASAEDPERLGVRAMLGNRLTRKLHSALNVKTEDGTVANKCLVVFLNQIRQAIGVYGDPTFSPGGLGMKFGFSVRVRVRKGDWIEEKRGSDKVKVGQTVKFKIIKNKTFAPQRVGFFSMFFSGDKEGSYRVYDEVLAYGIAYGLIKQAGSIYTFDSQKFKGKEALSEYMRSDEKIVKKLKAELIEVVTKVK